MLNIYFGKMEDAVYNTSLYFDNVYLDAWLEDDFAIRILKAIDKATVLNGHTVESKALGIIPVKQLSGGTKTLLLVYNIRKKVFNASTCGDNCAPWLLRIAKKIPEDVSINLYHIMDFGDKPFEIRIQNNGVVVHNMGELVLQAGAYLQGGDAQ